MKKREKMERSRSRRMRSGYVVYKKAEGCTNMPVPAELMNFTPVPSFLQFPHIPDRGVTAYAMSAVFVELAAPLAVPYT